MWLMKNMIGNMGAKVPRWIWVQKYVISYKTLGTCYLHVTCPFYHNMGDYECKTWQGENNSGKLQIKGNFTTTFLYWLQTMGKCNVKTNVVWVLEFTHSRLVLVYIVSWKGVCIWSKYVIESA